MSDPVKSPNQDSVPVDDTDPSYYQEHDPDYQRGRQEALDEFEAKYGPMNREADQALSDDPRVYPENDTTAKSAPEDQGDGVDRSKPFYRHVHADGSESFANGDTAIPSHGGSDGHAVIASYLLPAEKEK
jgi:hypothetical protein